MIVGQILEHNGAGIRNDLFLTCDDFEIAGDTPPTNCRPSP
jgi:hypothetical protein